MDEEASLPLKSRIMKSLKNLPSLTKQHKSASELGKSRNSKGSNKSSLSPPALEKSIWDQRNLRHSSLSRGKIYYDQYIKQYQEAYLKQDKEKKQQNRENFLNRSQSDAPPDETESLKKALNENRKHIFGTSLFVDASPDDPIKAPQQPELHKERTLNYIDQIDALERMQTEMINELNFE